MSRSVSAPSSVTNTSPCWKGDIVPGSTLMYGSSLTRETLILRDSRIAAREAAAIPFPREETTPPVTKTYLVTSLPQQEISILPGSRCRGGAALHESGAAADADLLASLVDAAMLEFHDSGVGTRLALPL